MTGHPPVDGRADCPLCGAPDIGLLADCDALGTEGYLLRSHNPLPGGPTRAGRSTCLGTYMEIGNARRVAAIRAENDGRLLRAAHP